MENMLMESLASKYYEAAKRKGEMIKNAAAGSRP